MLTPSPNGARWPERQPLAIPGRFSLIHIAARITRHARRLELHLPRHWRWAGWWMRLFDETHSPPPLACLPPSGLRTP
jgi:hypothetical protein